jgi:hypothetical protein
MGDISKRGRGLLGKGPQAPRIRIKQGKIGGPQAPEKGKPQTSRERAGPQAPGTRRRIKSFEEEVNAGPTESLGVYASGGYEGKPHSTKKGRIRAGQRELHRFFYGKKKPKGTII